MTAVKYSATLDFKHFEKVEEKSLLIKLASQKASDHNICDHLLSSLSKNYS
ncbi:hypothetical protein S7335_3850 [Synechococcus sp. PCC 7335]|nr:hypothetical protein S7335_3850 [Synechococcus sp. PCC 7335]